MYYSQFKWTVNSVKLTLIIRVRIYDKQKDDYLAFLYTLRGRSIYVEYSWNTLTTLKYFVFDIKSVKITQKNWKLFLTAKYIDFKFGEICSNV